MRKNDAFENDLPLEEPDQGSVVIASGTRIGYLSQITFEDEERTVYEELLTVFDELTTLQARLESQALVLEQTRPAPSWKNTRNCKTGLKRLADTITNTS